MNDTVLGVIIGGTFSLAVMLIQKIFTLLREQVRSKKEFLKDFYPIRLKAHQEIMRAVTESSLLHFKPETSTLAEFKIVLENTRQSFNVAALNNILVADRGVIAELFAAVQSIEALIKMIEPDGKGEAFFSESFEGLQRKYCEIIELLRENTGIDFIDQEFAKTLETVGKKKEKKGSRNKNNSQANGSPS